MAAKIAIRALLAAALLLPRATCNPNKMVVRVRLASGALRRVAFDGDDAPTLRDLKEQTDTSALFLDEACTEPADDDATLAELDVVHGSVVYAPREACAARAPDEARRAAPFFSPYPSLAKHGGTRRERTNTHANAKTWKALVKERETVFYVKSFDRVCEAAKLGADAVETFAALGGAGGPARAWLLGRRGTGRNNGTVHVEALHEAGADDDAVFSVAAALGLERRPVIFREIWCGKPMSNRDHHAW